MPPSSPARAPAPAPTPGSPRSSGPDLVEGLVAEIVKEQKSEAAMLREAEQRAQRRFPTWARQTVAAIICAVAWLAPISGPAPAPAPPLPPRYTMASGRIVLALAARRISDFQTRYGRLPSSLADANVDEAGLTFAPLAGNDFVLRLPVENVTLVYESTMAPAIQVEDRDVILRTTQR